MSTPFQNRLVGTIIVAAAVIIFLPDILDGEKESYQAEFEAIPSAPAFEGSKVHNAFPKEKLAEIPSETVSEEEAADDLLLAEIEAADSDNSVQQGADDINANNNAAVSVQPAVKEEAIISLPVSQPKTVEPAPVKDKLAWVIHLGSFKHQKNVDELMRKLKTNNYTAFTQPIKTKKGMLTKVIVGPDLNKAELQKKLPDLKKLTNVQGRLARFTIKHSN